MANLSNLNNKFLVTDGGNVLIGQTAVVGTSMLQVEGSTNAIIRMNSTGGTGGRIDLSHGGNVYGNIGSGKNMLGTGNASDMMINADSLLILGVGSQDMTILPSGNVGIGTNSPAKKLDVEGNIRALNTAGSTAAEIDVTSGGTWRFRSNPVSGDNSYGLDIIKGSAGTDVKMSINSSGRVGIGTSSPGKNVEIKGAASVYTTLRITSGSTAHGAEIEFGDSTDADYGSITQFASSAGEGGRMRFRAGAIETMNLRGGKVGIGTTNPEQKLELNSSSHPTIVTSSSDDDCSIAFKKGAGATPTWRIGRDTSNSDALSFAYLANGYPSLTGSYKAVITTAGNVGIGTDSPDRLLTLAANTCSYSTAPAVRFDSTCTDSVNIRNWAIGPADSDYGNFHIFKSTSRGGAPVNGAGAKTFTIDYTGNVGIGTISPVNLTNQTSLTIDGTSIGRVDCLAGGGGGGGMFASSSQLQVFSNFGVNLQLSSAADIDFVTGSTDRMKITSGGEIRGSRGNAGNLFFADSTSSAGSGIVNYNSSLAQQSNNTSCSHFKGTTQNIASYHLYGNGSSSWSSDSRLKRDIETTRDGYIDDINKLRVVKYKWKNDENSGQQLGLIAQEVEKIFPSLVVDHEDAVGNGETYKSLKYSVLPTILLKAMQEQQKMIQELKAEIELLKNK